MGGKAVIGVRAINQTEALSIIEDFKKKVLPLLRLNDYEIFVIGSAGNKPNPEDLSGDIDIGVPIDVLSKRAGIPRDRVEEMIVHLLEKYLPELQIKWMKGIHVISSAWPMGEEYAQVDIIPIEDMRWAKFIYHQPNYKLGESKYKSAHRNWLLASLFSVMEENKVLDESGNLVEFDGYLMRLTDGLFKIKKSFSGKTKLLKKSRNLREHEKFITRNPQEFINFLFGPKYLPNDLTTFEKVWEVVLSSEKYHQHLPKIKSNLIHFLERVSLPIPTEIKSI